MSVVIDLFQGLHDELSTRLAPLVIERRYMPRRDGADLDELKIALYMESTVRQEIVRDVVDAESYTFGIAVQLTAAEQVEFDDNGEPVYDGIDNLERGDAVINQMEAIKDLWRAGGELRNLEIAKCTFAEFSHDPIYEPYHLAIMGVYSSILDVTYQLTGS